MTRSLLSRWTSGTLRTFPTFDIAPGVPAAATGARVVGLAVIVGTIAANGSRPLGLSGRGLVLTVTLTVAVATWLTWMLAGDRPRVATPALVIMGLTGGILTAVTPATGAAAFGSVAAMSAGANLTTEAGAAITAGSIASFLIAGLITRLPAAALLGLSLCIAGFWSVGMTRRAYILRATQAERLLTETRRAASAEAEAATLAERTRIARDIHDVLAHSLAAVSVNLEAASGLLGSIPAPSGEVAKALECVDRAATLTRDGLADAKRAVHALREAAPPLAERVEALVADFGNTGDATATFTMKGSSRPVTADVGLTVYRTAQEALTNARKHAPGQPVDVVMTFMAAQISLEVVSGLADSAGALARTGGGYGLTGLRERAAAVGGVLDAGPADGRWRVWLRIPA